MNYRDAIRRGLAAKRARQAEHDDLDRQLTRRKAGKPQSHDGRTYRADPIRPTPPRRTGER